MSQNFGRLAQCSRRDGRTPDKAMLCSCHARMRENAACAPPAGHVPLAHGHEIDELTNHVEGLGRSCSGGGGLLPCASGRVRCYAADDDKEAANKRAKEAPLAASDSWPGLPQNLSRRIPTKSTAFYTGASLPTSNTNSPPRANPLSLLTTTYPRPTSPAFSTLRLVSPASSHRHSSSSTLHLGPVSHSRWAPRRSLYADYGPARVGIWAGQKKAEG